MSTYYIKLKSCSNAACEIQTLESLELPRSLDAGNIARVWGAGNGSKTVEVSVENYAGDIVVSPHAVTVYRKEPVVAPAPKPLRDVLSLDSAVKFHAVLEALQQFIDNGRDAEELYDVDEAKLEAAEELRDQLDATLASLAG